MRTTACLLAVLTAVPFVSARADTAVVHAYAEIVWDSMRLSFTPTDTALPPDSSHVSWVEESTYSGAYIDMAWWYWPEMETVGDYHIDHSGPEPDDPDYWAAGNGWGSGDVGENLGPVSGQADNEDSLVAQAEILLTQPDSVAECLSAAGQGGLIEADVAGTLTLSFDYIVSLEVIATGEASASGDTYAEFILFNHSDEDPEAPLIMDRYDLTGSVYAGAYINSYSPDPKSGTWSGSIDLGAGERAAFEGFVWAFAQGDTPPVPEPLSGLLLAMGLGGLALLRNRAA